MSRLFILLLIFVTGNIQAQEAPSFRMDGISTGAQQQETQPPSEVGTKLQEIREALKPAEAKEPVQVAPEQVRRRLGDEHFFAHPGIIAKRGGEWFGADHLYNLSNQIPVFVEILKAENVRIDLQTADVKEVVEKVLRKTTIETGEAASIPPFPYFHILIMISKVKLGYAVYCEGRLFEPVTLDRFHLDKDTFFQAITWERQNLIVVPPDQFQRQVYQTVEDIAEDFVDRYRFYEDIRIHTRNSRE